MPRRTPAQEMQEALEPLPLLADNDPATVFAVAALMSLEEMRHLASVFVLHLPALIQRAAVAERALVQDHLWPDQFFGDGSEHGAFQIMLNHFGPVLGAGGLLHSVQFQAVANISARERHCFACVVGCHMAIFCCLAALPFQFIPLSAAPG